MGKSIGEAIEATDPEDVVGVEDDAPDALDAETPTNGDGDGVSAASGGNVDEFAFTSTCPHLGLANPNKLKTMTLAYSPASVCTECTGSMRQKKAGNKKGDKGKGKGNRGKKTGKPAPDGGGLWICATCGNIACGRDSPYKHAEAHSKSGQRHQLAIQWEPRTLMVWCYECDDEIFVDESVPHTNIRNCLTILQGGTFAPSVKETVAMSNRDKRKQDKMLQQLEKKSRQQQWQQNTRVEKESSGTYDTGSTVVGKGVKGLANLGNTCFFNSVLQNLSHTRLLLDYYLTKENSVPTEVHGTMNLAMQEAVNLIWTEGKGSKFSPGNLFNAISKQFAMFRRKQQQDAHELLCCLLDGLASEEKQANKKGGSFTRSTFGGSLSSTVTCHECQMPSRTWEPYFILSLQIPLNASQTQIHNQHASEARLTNGKQRRKQERALKNQLKQQAEETASMIEQTTASSSTETPSTPSIPTTPLTDTPVDSSTSTETTTTTTESDNNPTPSPSTLEEPVNTSSSPSPSPSQYTETKETSPESSSVDKSSVSESNENTDNKEKKPIQGPVELRQWNGSPLKRSKGALTIQDCLLSFTDPEILEGANAFGCSECTKRVFGDQLDEELLEALEEINVNNTEETTESNEQDEPNSTSAAESADNSEATEAEQNKEKSIENVAEGTEPVAEEKSDATGESGAKQEDPQPEEPVEPTEDKFTVYQGKKKKKAKKHTQPSQPTASSSTSPSSSAPTKKKLVSCTATKQFLISTPPPVLVLHLKRFMQAKHSLQKISQNISFPSVLDLTPFLDHFRREEAPSSSSTPPTLDSPTPGSCEYKLTGVVEHSGSMNGGHYVAYFYNDADDKWYYASDTHVSISSLEHALKSEAYMLFYQKIQP